MNKQPQKAEKGKPTCSRSYKIELLNRCRKPRYESQYGSLYSMGTGGVQREEPPWASDQTAISANTSEKWRSNTADFPSLRAGWLAGKALENQHARHKCFSGMLNKRVENYCYTRQLRRESSSKTITVATVQRWPNYGGAGVLWMVKTSGRWC